MASDGRGSDPPSRRASRQDDSTASENTPLLQRRLSEEERGESTTNGDANPQPSQASSLLRRIQGFAPSTKVSGKRWPSLVALIVLCVAVIAILVVGFFAPEVVKEYAQQAIVFQPTSLSVDSYTGTGIMARIQGDFFMDASRVHKKSVRDLGRFGTWVAREVESRDAELQVYLPEYDELVLGNARIPPVKVNVRNGHVTKVNFLAELQPGPIEGIRRIANEWIEGRLGELNLRGDVSLPLKSGLFSLGVHQITQSILLGGDKLPSIPEYHIRRINIHETNITDHDHGLEAEVTLDVKNDYPVNLQIPPLGFIIYVDGCGPAGPRIQLADARTGSLHIKPKQNVALNVTGIISELPDEFLNACPKSNESPFDLFLGNYLHGNDATMYVQGSGSPIDDTPKWVTDLISSVTVPVSVPGRAPGDLIKNFTLADVRFALPDLFADPDSPEADPKISATVKALIGLPDEMNFPVDVDKVRANATIMYKQKPLGILDLHRWQPATSKAVRSGSAAHDDLLIESAIDRAPLRITNEDLFEEVVEALFLGSKPLNLSIQAVVDVDIITALGQFVVRNIPAKGAVPVKAIGGGGKSLHSLQPKIGDLQIVETTSTALVITAKVNVTNPTNYSATVPYASLNLLVNSTVIGRVTVQNVSINAGNNSNIPVEAVWSPEKFSGEKGAEVGRKLLSQYISGINTTLAFETSKDSIPALPSLGRALSVIKLELPTPNLRTPNPPNEGDPDAPAEDNGRFIQQATMHLFSSTADFVLKSPFSRTTLMVTSINATALYHDDVVGKIDHDEPIEVPPGLTQTPRLPVDWDLGSVGYEAIRKALGGELHLNATADVGLRIEDYETRLWYTGRGIGAKIRL